MRGVLHHDHAERVDARRLSSGKSRRPSRGAAAWPPRPPAPRHFERGQIGVDRGITDRMHRQRILGVDGERDLRRRSREVHRPTCRLSATARARRRRRSRTVEIPCPGHRCEGPAAAAASAGCLAVRRRPHRFGTHRPPADRRVALIRSATTFFWRSPRPISWTEVIRATASERTEAYASGASASGTIAVRRRHTVDRRIHRRGHSTGLRHRGQSCRLRDPASIRRCSAAQARRC